MQKLHSVSIQQFFNYLIQGLKRQRFVQTKLSVFIISKFGLDCIGVESDSLIYKAAEWL